MSGQWDNDSARGQDGGILNFMPDIADAARDSSGFVLEIGIGKGTGSTIAIQEGLADHLNPLHISVDQNDYLEVRPVTPWWHLVLGDSRARSVLEKAMVIARWRRPGVIFIDTDHTYEQMRDELALWSRIAMYDTTWLFHDVMMGGNYNVMTDAIKEFAAANGWVYDDFRTEPHGLGRMRRP